MCWIQSRIVKRCRPLFQHFLCLEHCTLRTICSMSVFWSLQYHHCNFCSIWSSAKCTNVCVIAVVRCGPAVDMSTRVSGYHRHRVAQILTFSIAFPMGGRMPESALRLAPCLQTSAPTNIQTISSKLNFAYLPTLGSFFNSELI